MHFCPNAFLKSKYLPNPDEGKNINIEAQIFPKIKATLFGKREAAGNKINCMLKMRIPSSKIKLAI
jgi:hypothetical protein